MSAPQQTNGDTVKAMSPLLTDPMRYVPPTLMVLLAAFAIFIISLDEIKGVPVDSTMQNILSFIIGVAGSQLGVHSGASAANTAQVISQNQPTTNGNGGA